MDGPPLPVSIAAAPLICDRPRLYHDFTHLHLTCLPVYIPTCLILFQSLLDCQPQASAYYPLVPTLHMSATSLCFACLLLSVPAYCSPVATRHPCSAVIRSLLGLDILCSYAVSKTNRHTCHSALLHYLATLSGAQNQRCKRDLLPANLHHHQCSSEQ